MHRRVFLRHTASSLALSSVALSACTTSMTPTVSGQDNAAASQRKADPQRRELNTGIDATLERLRATVPNSVELVNKANGVLVFPRVIAAGFGIGGQYGEGALRIHNSTTEYYNLASVSIGLQIGAQSKAIVMLFMTDEALKKLRTSDTWSAGIDASVAVLKVGANGAIDSTSMNGPVLAFVMTNAGLMANLSLEGTKITRVKT
jgi:lipid-binding SYLF domain-containing protein